MFCARLFICASWSPAGKGLTSWLSFVVSSVSLSLSHWYPGSGVVLDCIDSWSLQPYLLFLEFLHIFKRYLEEGLVCSSVLRKGLLTTVAINNTDHNPSSKTAKSSFHGTSISIFQHPINNNFGEQREMLHIAEWQSTKKEPPLPRSYTNVQLILQLVHYFPQNARTCCNWNQTLYSEN